MCQLREHLARIFFPAHCTCMNFFWHDGLVQEFFSFAYALAGYFFSKSPTPPPPPQKLNGRPLIKPERSYIVTGQLNHISMVWKLRSRNSQDNNGLNVVLENVISIFNRHFSGLTVFSSIS